MNFKVYDNEVCWTESTEEGRRTLGISFPFSHSRYDKFSYCFHLGDYAQRLDLPKNWIGA